MADRPRPGRSSSPPRPGLGRGDPRDRGVLGSPTVLVGNFTVGPVRVVAARSRFGAVRRM
ncbi:hypothetical protein [Amycolatopsis ultiminotia]|uniref:hypothetical protein n=1 Tax=Amycolatopsis ultiminotia TaxID=543629 RepID=UPI0031E65AA3